MAGVQLTRVFEELGGGARKPLASRPFGADLLAVLKAGDIVVVAGLSHAFISASEAAATAGKWKRCGIELIVADLGPEPVTRNGVSRLYFSTLILIADLKRLQAKERVTAGRGALDRMRELTEAGLGLRGIAAEVERRLGFGASDTIERGARRNPATEAVASSSVLAPGQLFKPSNGGADSSGVEIPTQAEAAGAGAQQGAAQACRHRPHAPAVEAA